MILSNYLIKKMLWRYETQNYEINTSKFNEYLYDIPFIVLDAWNLNGDNVHSWGTTNIKLKNIPSTIHSTIFRVTISITGSF